MKYISPIIILLWFVLSIYIGCGGLTSLELTDENDRISKLVVDAKDTIAVKLNGLSFENKSAANIYAEEKEHDRKARLAASIFPWLNFPYSFMGLMITSFAFGVLGGTISLLKGIALTNTNTENSKIFSLPLLGGGCGILILSIAYILPILIVSGETQVRPVTIVFVSLFAGLFTDKFFQWLASNFDKIFKTTP